VSIVTLLVSQPAPVGRAERAATVIRSLSSPGVGVLALSLPILFLHISWQPRVTLRLGAEGATVALSDVAVVAVVLAAVHAGTKLGYEPLRNARAVVLAAAALLALVGLGTFHPLVGDNEYAFADHALTAAKFAEYALLTAAVPLLVRTRDDLTVVVGVLVLWTAAAALVGVLQFLGLIREFE